MYRRPPKNEGLLEVWRTVGLNNKIPPKIKWQKFVEFVKLTGHTCACNCLTKFQYAEHAMTRNGKYVACKKLVKTLLVNLLTATLWQIYNTKRKRTGNGSYVIMLKLACKKSWKHLRSMNLFSGNFSHLEPQCGTRQAGASSWAAGN